MSECSHPRFAPERRPEGLLTIMHMVCLECGARFAGALVRTPKKDGAYRLNRDGILEARELVEAGEKPDG